MRKNERRAAINQMMAHWDAEIGERPENLESALGSFLKDMPFVSVWRAMEIAANNNSLGDSEDVLDNMRGRVKRWRNSRPANGAQAIAARHGEEV